MRPNEATARAFATFAAGYPSAKKVDESTIRLWAENLADYSGDLIEQAARRWVKNESRFPNLAQFLDAVRALIPPDARGDYRHDCGVCTDGWLETSMDGRGTVTRCPNGCQPPRPGQASEFRNDRAGVDVIARIRQSREDLAVRRKEIGDEAYLIERGKDPAKFRISDGMILAKIPEKAGASSTPDTPTSKEAPL